MVTPLSVPHDVPLQPAPDRDQATPLLWGSFVSVALNTLVPIPACTLAVVGETVTMIADAVVKVIVAVLDFVPSRLDVAVSVTVAGLGRVAGAV